MRKLTALLVMTGAIACLGYQGPGLQITTAAALPIASVGVHYDQVLAVSGGTAPYLWFLTSYVGTPGYPGIPNLPGGLNLDAASGEISGTPTTPGSYTISLYVLDSSGSPLNGGLITGAGQAARQFTLTIQ